MSGFELERQSLSEKLTHVTEVSKRFSQGEMSRDLLKSLQRSSDIVRDLWALYVDRPYVYARVMQQLGKVMGKAQLRKIHNDVLGRTKAAEQETQQAAKKPLKKSAKFGSQSLPPSKGDDAGSSKSAAEDEGEREFTVNLPKLGLKNVKVKVGSAEGQQSLSATDLPIPFLKGVTGAVTFSNRKVSKISASGQLDAALMESAHVGVDLTRVGTEGSKYTPNVTIDVVNLKIPGLDDGLTTKLALADGDSVAFEGEISGASKILGDVSLNGHGKVKTAGSDTSIDGTLEISKSAGGKGSEKLAAAPGEKSAAKPEAGGGASAGVSYTGSVTINANAGTISAAKGILSLSNVSILADPASTVELEVDYDGAAFKASLLNSVTLAEYEFKGASKMGAAAEGGDKKSGAKGGRSTAVQLTIESATYDGGLDADCLVSTRLGGIIQADGTVHIAKNNITGGQVTINAEEVPIIGNKAFLSTTLAGDIAIDEQGFNGSATGSAKFRVGKRDILVNLDESKFSSDGQLSGKVSLAQPVEFNPLKFETLVADFASSEGLTHVDGLLSLDTPFVKSDENGIAVTYAEQQLNAKGKLNLSGPSGGGAASGGDTVATCDFEANLNPDAFKGKGDFLVTKDYKVGSSKLQILKDSTAKITLTEAGIEPVAFEGKYDYGHGASGAKDDAKSGGGKSDKGGGVPLMFSGDFTGCTYDVNTGMLNGSATAVLESDIEYKSALVDVKIDSKRRGEQTQFNVKIAHSAVESLAGSLCYQADVPLKVGKGKGEMLYIEGKIDDFTLNVPEEKFSGTIKNSLRKDLWLVGETKAANSLKLNGNLRNNLTFVVENNEIASIEVDAEAETKITHRYFEEGSEKFSVKLKDAFVDKDTLDVTSGQATIRPLSDVKMVFSKGQTKLTVNESSHVEASIKDSIVESVTLKSGFSGETSALKTDTPIEFAGATDFVVTDIQGAGKIDGNIEVAMTKDCIVDAIEDVDEIVLRKGSKFGLEMSESEIDKVTGSMSLDYAIKAGNIQSIPDGFAARLSCTRMNYRPAEKKFSGDVSVGPAKDIVFKPGEGGGESGARGADGSFTLKAKGTGLKAKLKDNKLKSLAGTAGFEAKASLTGTTNNASVDFKDGVATLELDIDTGVIHSLDVSSNVALNAQLSDKLTIRSEAGTVSGKFDAKGLAEATFSGKINIDFALNNGEVANFVVDSKEGVSYTRETGFSGAVSLSCLNRVKLGEIASGKYEYGFGGGEGGEGAAASIDASIENSTINRITGKAGLFLEEKSDDKEASLLKVRGNIEFDYDVVGQVLASANGKADIDEKELCKVGNDNKLMLKKSEVDVLIVNNELESIKGKVNLALADADGDYMAFKSEENFDCTGDVNKFSATVEGHFTREKLIGESGTTQFFVTDKGADIGTSFTCVIVDNEIESLSGGFGILVKTDNTPLFQGGIVDGSYDKASGSFSGQGKIDLLKDLDLPKDGSQFALKAGSGGTATLEKGVVKDIEGDLIIGLKGPKVEDNESASEIIVENHAKLDVASQVIESFHGVAQLTGAKFQITNGLALTSLTGEVDIKQNKLEEIGGAASIEFTKGDFTLTGTCNDFGWKKGAGGADDVIHFDGGLKVSALGGRLNGEANVKYNSATHELTADGELDFKITEWLTGKVSVEFPNGSWDNPTIKGSLIANDVELVPARTLMAFGKDLKLGALQAMAGPIPIVAQAGIGLGASVDMDAIRFDANLDIGPFALNDLKNGELPDFEIGLGATTGLKLSANIAPYISVGIGASFFSAGIRVKGKAALDASVDGSVGGKLTGGKKGFGGELELGFGVSASASLTITPELYAEILGYKPTCPITEFKYDFGDIFKFDWSKKFTFGDKVATTESEGSIKTPIAPSVKETTAEAKKGEEAAYKSKESSGSGGVEKGKPQLPKAGDVGKDSMGKNVNSDDDVKGADSVAAKIKTVAEGVSAIGDAVNFVSQLISSFAFGGVLGVGVFLAIKIIKGELTFATIKAKIKAIKDGFEALKDLIKGGWRQFLPPKLLEAIEFIEQLRENGILQKVIEAVEKKVKSMSSPFNRILAPMVDFLKDRAEALGDLAEKMLVKNMSFSQLVKAAAALIGFAISSPLALLRTVGKMAGVVKQIIKECIADGLIYLKYTPGLVFNDYTWQVTIPGLCDWKGTSWPVAKALQLFGLKAERMK